MEKNDVVVPRGQEILYNNFHFAPAVKDKDHLYCSGVIGMGPDGKVSSDPETQFMQAFEGIKGVLEAAGLVVYRREGREKLHYLNPVPIRLIHDRWIDKYTERHVAALSDLKTELEAPA